MSTLPFYFRCARRVVVVHFVLAVVMSATRGLGQGTLEDDLRRAAVRVGADDRPHGEADVIADKAAEAFRAGGSDQALALYDQAAGVAYKSGAKGRAFEYALAGAEIQRSRGAWTDAAERFRRAGLANINDPRAVKAHQIACQLMGEALRAHVDSAELLAAYDQFLAEHSMSWPRSPTAAEMEWLRIELLMARSKWTDLADVTRTVPANHPRHERARELLVSAHERLLSNATLSNFDERINNATADLQPIILSERGLWPAQWSPLQRRASIVLARAHLTRVDGGAEYTKRLLQVALQSEPPAPPRWRREAAAVLVVAELTLGNHAGAERLLASELTATPEARLNLLGAIRTRLDQASSTERLTEAKNLLQQIDALSAPADAPDPSKSPTLRARAAALADSGQHAKALHLYSSLLAAEPNDRALLVAQARQYEALRTLEGMNNALRTWRAIEARTKRSTDAWIEARLERMRLLLTLGHREEALKLFKLTKLTVPRILNTQLQQRFEQIKSLLQ